MKVAVLIDTWFPTLGGGQTNAWEISKRLARKGVQIEIITRNIEKDNLKQPKNLKIKRIGVVLKTPDTISRVLFLISAYLYILKNDFNIIHAHAFLPGICARLLLVTKGIPAVYTVHGTSIHSKLNKTFSNKVEKFLLTKILYSAEISVSRDFLINENINRKIFYVPNGVILKEKKINRKKVNIFSILYVGRLHPQKNLVRLINAFSKISVDFPQTSLQIVGSGPQKAQLSKLSSNLNLKRKVNFLGEASGLKLAEAYKSAHMFVQPSLYEGQSISLLDALAFNLPVVASNVGDNPFIGMKVKNLYLIKNPEDINDIYRTIKKAIQKITKQKPIINNRDYLIKNHSWGNVTNATLDIYKTLL